MNTPTKTTRLHSLDALRGAMMLLGVVLHAGLTYSVTDHGDHWGVQDSSARHLVVDYVVLLIHSFRMQVFFFIAGFFGAMLFYERGRGAMVANRIRRIVYPLLVSLIVLVPLSKLGFAYSRAALSGAASPWRAALESFAGWLDWLPTTTLHLWFLYYLVGFTGIGVLLATVRRGRGRASQSGKVVAFIFAHPLLRLITTVSVTAALLAWFGTAVVNSSHSFTPDVASSCYFGLFYACGWVVYHHRESLPTLMRYDWLSTGAGVGLITLLGILLTVRPELSLDDPSALLILINAASTWLFVFGVTGLSTRYARAYHPAVSYLSRASYWVYLVHLPVTALLPGLIGGWPVPAIVKFLFVIAVTALVALLSYHFLVRNTFIGEFLNGRRYAAEPAVAAPKVKVELLPREQLVS